MRETIVNELAAWLASGTTIDAAFVSRYGPPGLVAATRKTLEGSKLRSTARACRLQSSIPMALGPLAARLKYDDGMPVAKSATAGSPVPVRFNGVKVFSATMVAQRGALGDVVTDWIRANQQLEIVDLVVSQSSDASFHCIAISVFYREVLKRPG